MTFPECLKLELMGRTLDQEGSQGLEHEGPSAGLRELISFWRPWKPLKVLKQDYIILFDL